MSGRRARRTVASAQPRVDGTSTAPRGRVRAGDVVCWLLLLAVSAVPCWPLYSDPYLLITLVGGLVAGLAVAVPTALRHLPWHLTLALTAVVYLLVGVPLAVPSAAVASVLPSPEGLARLVTGTATAWVDVLSVDPPLGRYGTVLVPVLVLMLACTVVGWRALCAGRRFVSVLSPAALALYGIVFGPRTGVHPVLVGAGALLIGLAWIILRSPRPHGVDRAHTRRLRAGNRRRAAVAVCFVIVCAVAGVGLTAAMTPDHRSVLRTAYRPTYQPLRHVSPLQQYRDQVTGDAATESVATVSGLPRGQMLRVAVLDDYNGVAMGIGTSASSGSFARLPSDVARPGQDAVQVSVHLQRPWGEWVPVLSSLDRIGLQDAQRDELYYDRELGAAVERGGLPAGTRYTVVADPSAAPMRSGLDRLSPGRAVQPDLVHLPEELVAAAQSEADGATTPGERLQADLSYLYRGYVSHGEDDEAPSRSGHSVERLDLLAQSEPMIGDAEQYAAAFAILARQEGFPSRVVLGYVDADDDGTLVGSELTAWVEVQDADRGWVAVDPNPEPRPVRQHSTTREHSVALPRTVLPPDPPQQRDPTLPRADESTQPPAPQPPAWRAVVAAVWWWTWRAGLVVALLTSPLWVLAVLEAARRNRRRRRDRQAREVAGGWHELRDELIDAGVPAPRSATRREVADGSAHTMVRRMAERADTLTFAPAPVQPADVEAYWDDVLVARRELLHTGSRKQRWLRRFSWRSVAARAREAWRA